MNPNYKRFFYLIAKRNLGSATQAELAELDQWTYSNTECPRIMFDLFTDPQFADSLDEIARSLRP